MEKAFPQKALLRSSDDTLQDMRKLFVFLLIVAAFVLGAFFGRSPIAALLFAASGVSESPQGQTKQPATNDASAKSGIVVQTAQLSDGQRRLLSVLGIDANSVTITPQMIACGEEKLGATRTKEITGGATPSFTEGLALLACYR